MGALPGVCHKCVFITELTIRWVKTILGSATFRAKIGVIDRTEIISLGATSDGSQLGRAIYNCNRGICFTYDAAIVRCGDVPIHHIDGWKCTGKRRLSKSALIQKLKAYYVIPPETTTVVMFGTRAGVGQ